MESLGNFSTSDISQEHAELFGLHICLLLREATHWTLIMRDKLGKRRTEKSEVALRLCES